MFSIPMQVLMFIQNGYESFMLEIFVVIYSHFPLDRVLFMSFTSSLIAINRVMRM